MGSLVENSPIVQVMASGGQALVTPRGDPIPPADVVRELAEISPRLKIEWVNGAWGASYFGLKERWRDGDPRWERVRTGELSEAQAFDLLTMFPREVRPDDMLGWIRGKWGDRGRVKDPRAEADRLVEQARKLYQQADATNVDRVIEDGIQKVKDDTDHQRLVRAGAESAHPMITVPDREPKRLLEIAK